MVSLCMDHHVPSAITAGLRKRGVDVLTAEEDGSARLDDDPLLNRATSLGRVLFSQDQDLLAIAHWRLANRPGFLWRRVRAPARYFHWPSRSRFGVDCQNPRPGRYAEPGRVSPLLLTARNCGHESSWKSQSTRVVLDFVFGFGDGT